MTPFIRSPQRWTEPGRPVALAPEAVDSSGGCTRRRWLALAGPLLAGSALPVMAQPAPNAAAEVTVFESPAPARQMLRIDSATDTALFAPVIRAFQRRHPDVAVRYADRQSLDIHARALAYAQAGPASSRLDPANPDLLISSSLDLQTQLANDGLALPHRSEQALSLPAGAHWRHEVFSLGAEPVVMVYHPRLLPPAQAPRTRGQLLELLRQPDGPLQGRVGTYDVTLSGLGYMLATQDARFDSTASLLLASLGAAGVVLGDHIVPLLERLERQQLALLYNVPASYAQARIAAGSPIRVVYPQDYTLLTTRAALVPGTAAQPALAKLFLDELLSPEGQALLSRETRLLPIRQALAAGQDSRVLRALADGPGGVDVAPSAWRPLMPGLGLLVYLDPLKRERFLLAWRTAMAARLPARLSP